MRWRGWRLLLGAAPPVPGEPENLAQAVARKMPAALALRTR